MIMVILEQQNIIIISKLQQQFKVHQTDATKKLQIKKSRKYIFSVHKCQQAILIHIK